MSGDPSQREILASLRWPDAKQRLEEQAEAVRPLSPTERLERVEELRSLCVELAAAAGSLRAMERYHEWRETQWRDRIREAIRLYERRQAGGS